MEARRSLKDVMQVFCFFACIPYSSRPKTSTLSILPYSLKHLVMLCLRLCFLSLLFICLFTIIYSSVFLLLHFCFSSPSHFSILFLFLLLFFFFSSPSLIYSLIRLNSLSLSARWALWASVVLLHTHRLSTM